MATIVLVHGIAQEQEGPASLEDRWLPALASGLAAAGHAELAARIWPLGCAHRIDVKMAAYGDLFLDPGAQGEGDGLEELDPEGRALARALAAEWLHRAADRGQAADRDAAVLELSYMESGHEEQGLREELGRAIIKSVTRLRWFAPLGFALAERFVNTSLTQVSRYFTDPVLHERILDRVLEHIGPETKAIIAHSLGSVVAYEVAGRLTNPVPLLVTLGSPLGLRTCIYDRIQPRPPVYPNAVHRWVNIADRNDLVAADPDLARLFPVTRPAGDGLDSGWLTDATVDNGPQPHQGEYYLQKRRVGAPIADALAGDTGSGVA
jgi:hypothetical protein